MKLFGILLVLLLPVMKTPAQMERGFHGQSGPSINDSYGPLLIYTNGGGKIFLSYPFRSGVRYWAGQSCEAVAIPDPGYVFVGWKQVNVFTLTTEEIVDEAPVPFVVSVESTDFSLVPGYYFNPMLKFAIRPEEVVLTESTTNEDMVVVTNTSLTVAVGWQANFVRQPGRRHNQ